MKNKRFTVKILIDIGMTICLLLLMPYSLLSETAHEWIGMAMLVLFISHHILNYKWVTSVRKGKYNAFRVIQTVLVIAELDKKTSSFFSHQDPNMVEWFVKMVEERKKNNDSSKEKRNW